MDCTSPLQNLLSFGPLSYPPPTPTPAGLGFVREDKSIQLLGTNIMDKDKCTGCKVFPKKIAVYPFDESVQLQGTNILEKKYIEYKIVHTKKLMFQKFPKWICPPIGWICPIPRHECSGKKKNTEHKIVNKKIPYVPINSQNEFVQNVKKFLL